MPPRKQKFPTWSDQCSRQSKASRIDPSAVAWARSMAVCGVQLDIDFQSCAHSPLKASVLPSGSLVVLAIQGDSVSIYPLTRRSYYLSGVKVSR